MNMKRYMISLLVAFFAAVAVKAMSYEEARDQARYLTDKMAYELNLNDEQYDDAYEINLDYLMGLRTADDVYGPALTYRNADLRFILHDWQYTLFAAADYFFHPVYWRAGVWCYPVYTYYRPGFFYYSTPRVYVTYRGGHGRAHYARVSYYNSRRPVWRGGLRGEHRGPVTHRGPGAVSRPHPGNRPGRPHHDARPQEGRRPGRGDRDGYRFDPVRPDKGNRPERGEAVRPSRPERGGASAEGPGRGGTSVARPEKNAEPVARPVSNRPSRSYGGATPAAPVRQHRSDFTVRQANRPSVTYNRQSSTRSTVRSTPSRPAASSRQAAPARPTRERRR